MAVSFEALRRIALTLPGMVEGTAYGTPAFRVGKTFLGRLREPGIFALKLNIDERDMLIAAAPEIFFITEHYAGYPYVLVRLERCEPERMERLMERAWRGVAKKGMAGK